ncbi:hypothetical protein OpiT1DRAFT_05843 [Opitutaceae bacterium TAV1]|nr:hypothetical protein OpiT1DRAFT_05843 [Opitutaceae bacterium TAV1]
MQTAANAPPRLAGTFNPPLSAFQLFSLDLIETAKGR